MDAAPWFDLLDQNFKFSTLRSTFPSATRLPLQKCCGYGEFFSFIDERCVPVDLSSAFSAATADPRPSASEFEIRCGLNCAKSNLTIAFAYLRGSVEIGQFFANGSLNAVFGRKREPAHFELGEYCFDVEKEMLNPLVLTCQPALVAGTGSAAFAFVFYVSVALWIIAFSLYSVMPELRKRVYDKCFVCFMGFGVLPLLLMVVRSVTDFERQSIKFRFISLTCIYYLAMVCYCWLHVMCFHLWRTVTTTKAIPGRHFYFYALFAVGLPVICCAAFSIDLRITGWELFLRRWFLGGLMSDPFLLYFIHICAVQQVINTCLFIHVGYLIWYQKQPWNEDSPNGGQKHVGQRKTVTSRLIRLSVLMGMDWINIFLLNYFNSRINMDNIFYLIYHINMCPGYAIFVTYVWCREQVYHPLEQKHPRIMKVGSCAVKILFCFSLFMFIYFVINRWGKVGQTILEL